MWTFDTTALTHDQTCWTYDGANNCGILNILDKVVTFAVKITRSIGPGSVSITMSAMHSINVRKALPINTVVTLNNSGSVKIRKQKDIEVSI